MEKGYSVVTEISSASTPDYNSFLFDDPQHHLLQADDWLNFYLLRKANQKIMARVSFHVKDHKAYSPMRASFGSFNFSRDLSPLVLYQFIQECERHLVKKKIRSVRIIEPPLFYNSSGELLQTILFNLGYHVTDAQISSGIRIDNTAFDDKIESWEKRKLKQAKVKGLTFKKLPISELETVYKFILKCRDQRGHSLSMTLSELTETVNVFKSSFFLFGAYHKNELAAASISIRVHQDILYNFYSGHLKKFDAISPVVLLISGIYKFCGSNKIHLLDLGTSAVEGQPNFSLLDFKLRLGAIPSMKLTFEKDLV
ncbi:MAG: hypothetical protein HOP08_13525 [Cyclobacteriaceae bacterium]|nr:hypothetical protein [Cyclobacteriaceae bacterium]